jgi:hypothetical protein
MLHLNILPPEIAFQNSCDMPPEAARASARQQALWKAGGALIVSEHAVALDLFATAFMQGEVRVPVVLPYYRTCNIATLTNVHVHVHGQHVPPMEQMPRGPATGPR